MHWKWLWNARLNARLHLLHWEELLPLGIREGHLRHDLHDLWLDNRWLGHLIIKTTKVLLLLKLEKVMAGLLRSEGAWEECSRLLRVETSQAILLFRNFSFSQLCLNGYDLRFDVAVSLIQIHQPLVHLLGLHLDYGQVLRLNVSRLKCLLDILHLNVQRVLLCLNLRVLLKELVELWLKNQTIEHRRGKIFCRRIRWQRTHCELWSLPNLML